MIAIIVIIHKLYWVTLQMGPPRPVFKISVWRDGLVPWSQINLPHSDVRKLAAPTSPHPAAPRRRATCGRDQGDRRQGKVTKRGIAKILRTVCFDVEMNNL